MAHLRKLESIERTQNSTINQPSGSNQLKEAPRFRYGFISPFETGT